MGSHRHRLGNRRARENRSARRLQNYFAAHHRRGRLRDLLLFGVHTAISHAQSARGVHTGVSLFVGRDDMAHCLGR